MLSSIHPLGERGRARRWGLTVSAYLVGSLAGGSLLGAALGAIGGPLHAHVRPGGAVWAALVGLGALAGVLVDAGVGGLTVPTIRRQVDEDWLHRYRGW